MHLSLIVPTQYSALLFLLPCKVLLGSSGGTMLSKEKGVLWLLDKYSTVPLVRKAEKGKWFLDIRNIGWHEMG